MVLQEQLGRDVWTDICRVALPLPLRVSCCLPGQRYQQVLKGDLLLIFQKRKEKKREGKEGIGGREQSILRACSAQCWSRVP
jgi:hypothetical protein